MKIDAHHHLWKYSKEEYDWIDDNMAVLKQDFLAQQLVDVLSSNEIQGSIVVQARQSIVETDWLLNVAAACDEIKGVVGWVDLKSPALETSLIAYQNNEKLVGFRHVIQGETDPNFMREPQFIAGLKLLAKYNYTFDLLIFAHQLPAAVEMLQQVPELKVVIDHIAKPEIMALQKQSAWLDNMAKLAANPSTHCKLSGMVTEADWENWQASDFDYYLESCYQLFGPQRLMFGSDWPVCLVAAEYHQVKGIVSDFLDDKPSEDANAIFGENAANFYLKSAN